MRKIFTFVYLIVIIAFVLWGIITINIINTSKISGGEYNINNKQYAALYSELQDNIFGFVKDTSSIKIKKDEDGYVINLLNNTYMLNTTNIKKLSHKLSETGEILHRGVNNIKIGLIGEE